MLELKANVCVYGAGRRAVACLPVLKEYFNVKRVLDVSPLKQGESIQGVKIVAPSKELLTMHPLIVLMKDVNGVLDTLKLYGFKGVFYWCAAGSSQGMILVEVRYDEDAKILYNRIWQLSKKTGEIVPINENADVLVEGDRIFNIASPIDFGGPGGPIACLRNMWLANKDYQLMENFFTACPSAVYVPKNAIVNKSDSDIEPNGVNLSKELSMLIKNNKTSVKQLEYFLTICNLKQFLAWMNRRFKFNGNDIFLLQDTNILLAFIDQFPHLKRIATAYHGQGVMSSELKKSNPEILDIMDEVQLMQLRKIKHWIFPSMGAVEGFLQTATPAMRKAAESCEFHVAYNGYERKEIINPDKDFQDFLESLNADIIFASASFLYRNKGVERIPRVLSNFKNSTGARIHWVLVGGGEMQEEVEKEIGKYLNEDEYTWFKKRFDNQDNIFALFQKADFYIMMHRVSVFDLSTLQAMSYKCVPFLSDVGGNKELCGFNNGILCNPDSGELKLDKIIEKDGCNKASLEKLKEDNARIIKEKFNNHAFLSGYFSVLKEL